MAVIFKDQTKYEKYVKDKETDSLPMITKEESEDSKYEKCFIYDAEKPLSGNPSLPTTAFMECKGKLTHRVKLR